MTPLELNQLPETQQRNALLAIALGYEFDYTRRSASSSEWAFGVYTPYRATSVWLHDWRPAGDSALMWALFCADYFSFAGLKIGFACRYTNQETGERVDTEVYSTREQAIITAYIAADPKGLIAKWRKEND